MKVIFHPRGCWEYLRSREALGYCRLMIDRRRYGAHRLSWIFFYGPIPKSKFVCHRCDNPSCVNPKHLFLGTQSDNILDCLKKGRLKSAKLKPANIREIRRKISGGDSFRKIGRQFGVHHKTISMIENRTAWGHV